MSRGPWAGVVLGVLPLCGCALGAEDVFIGKRHLDACDGAVPVCSTTAGCRLGQDENYVDVTVPGYRTYVVNTKGEADLVMTTYWKKQLAPGKDVNFTFYEPGCGEPHRLDTTGEEMFNHIGQNHQWSVTQTVYEAGDHLVEVRMDAQGQFLLKVDIITPAERGKAGRGGNVAPEPGLPGWP